jgi:hypothetical protein
MVRQVLSICVACATVISSSGADSFSYPAASQQFEQSASVSATGACVRGANPPQSLPLVVELVRNATGVTQDSQPDNPDLEEPNVFPFDVVLGGTTAWPHTGAHTLKLWPSDHSGSPTATREIEIVETP